MFLDVLKILATYSLFSAAIIVTDIYLFYSDRQAKPGAQNAAPLTSVQTTNLSLEILLAILHVLMFVMVVRLYCFHVWLMKHNMTTLEYFLKHKEKVNVPGNTRNDTRVAPASLSDVPRRRIKAIDIGHSQKLVDDDPKTSVRNSKNILENQQEMTPRSSQKSHGSGGSTPGHRDTERLPISQNKPDSTARLLGSGIANRQSGMQRVIINNLQSASQFPTLQSKNSQQKNPAALPKKNLSLIQRPVKRLRSGSQEATKTDGLKPDPEEATSGRISKNLPKQLPPLVLNGIAKKSLHFPEKREDIAKDASSGIFLAKVPGVQASDKSFSQSQGGQSNARSPDANVQKQTESLDPNKASAPVVHRLVLKSGATSVELLSQTHHPHLSVDGSAHSNGPSA